VPDAAPPPTVEQELADIKMEMTALRQLLEKITTAGDAK